MVRKLGGCKLISMVIVAILSVGMLSGCGKEERNDLVRIGFFPNITHAQALVAKDQGTLETALGTDVEVTWTSFNAGPAEVEALFADEIDIGYIGPVPAINANIKSNGDVSILTNTCDAGAVLIKAADAEISSIGDLAGKTVAIPQVGNTQHLCLLSLLSENGLATTENGGDVRIVAVENSDLQNMFDQGEIDAALPPEPWGSILEKNSGAEVVLDYDEILLSGNYPSAVVVVRNDFMDANPEIVAQFLEVHKDMTEYINTNMEEAAHIVNSQIEQIKGKTYDEDVLFNAFSRINITTEINVDAIEAFAKMCMDEGFVSGRPNDNLLK